MKNTIHIWDLPVERVYIKLNNDFRERFFKLAHDKFGSWDKLAYFFNIKRGDTLLAKDWRYGLCCAPLFTILSIANKIGISKEEIEKNIVEIKSKVLLKRRGGSSGKSINKPKLPIKIDNDLIEILGHICGDGSIGRSHPNKGISLRYTNSEPALIESFKEKVKKVFGNIEPNMQVRNGPSYKRENYQLQYPTIVSLFILSIFDCQSNEKKDIPNFIFELSKKAKYRFLRALYDDEGTVAVEDKSITIGLKPKEVVNKIRSLLANLDFNPSKIFFSGEIYKIKIGKSKDIRLFKRLIGFKHPLKTRKLDLIIKRGWKFNRYENEEAEKRIVYFLKDKQIAKTEEIIRLLNRCPSTTREHLNNLKNKNFIVNKRDKEHFVWSIK